MRQRRRQCACATAFSSCGSQQEPHQQRRNAVHRQLALGFACRLDRLSRRGLPCLPYHHVRVFRCWCWCVPPRPEHPHSRYRRHGLPHLSHGPGSAIAHERNLPRERDLLHRGIIVVNRRYVPRWVDHHRRRIRRPARRSDRECRWHQGS